jgi:hypothetical protein
VAGTLGAVNPLGFMLLAWTLLLVAAMAVGVWALRPARSR